MNGSHSAVWSGPGRSLSVWRDETVSLIVGVGVTAGLFWTMARFERGGQAPVAPVIEEIRQTVIPMETPPPPPITTMEPRPVVDSVPGIEVASAPDSAVQISVSVPVLNDLTVTVAPPAHIQTATVFNEFKPRMELAGDSQRVFQQSEVDKRPTAEVRTTPLVPPWVRQRAEILRVTFLMIINIDGSVVDPRVLKSSGNPKFDAIVLQCLRDEWVFRPAVRHGKRVKCLVQQSLAIEWKMTTLGN